MTVGKRLRGLMPKRSTSKILMKSCNVFMKGNKKCVLLGGGGCYGSQLTIKEPLGHLIGVKTDSTFINT